MDYGIAGIGIAPTPEDFKPGKGDEQLLVIFRTDILQDEAKSITEGRPIFVDAEWVRILVPGDKTNVLDRPASQQDKARFATQYARFRQGLKEDEQVVGTPLREWPMVTRSLVEEMRFFNIVTVEHLADVNDAIKMKMPGLNKLAQQAKIWLERTKATGEVAKASAKMDEQAARIASLEAAVRDLMHQNERLAEKAGEPLPA